MFKRFKTYINAWKHLKVIKLYQAGRYEKAILYAKRLLEITEKSFGKDYPEIVTILNTLAELYRVERRFSEAEPLYRRALEICEKTIPKDNLFVVRTLNNLAEFYRQTGRLSEAEPLYRKALEICEKTIPEDNPFVARTFNNLAEFYSQTVRLSEAEPLYRRVLEIREKTRALPELVAISLNNLAVLYCSTGRFLEAKSLFERALEIREKVFPVKHHPDVIQSFYNLAVLYTLTEKYTDARVLFKTTLELTEKAWGKNHPNVAPILNSLALLYATVGEHTNGHGCFKMASKISERVIEGVFTTLSERQKMEYIATLEGNMNGFLSHTAQYLINDPEACKNTLDAWLRWKGCVLESELRARGVLSVKVEVDSRTVSEMLPDGSFLIEFAHTSFRDFKASKWQDAHYLAFVLSSNTPLNPLLIEGKSPPHPNPLPHGERIGEGGVTLIDLGKAEEIDKLINAYRDVMKGGELANASKLSEISRELYRRVFEPIKEFVGADIYVCPNEKGEHTGSPLHISPDGDLNLIPFEVFMTPEGKYLIDEYQINYVSAGRDIMRFKSQIPSAKSQTKDVVIMADPYYDLDIAGRIEKKSDDTGVSVSRDMGDIERFYPLPGTGEEAEEIKKIVVEKRCNVECYLEEKAVEEVLHNIKEPPWILHLATHGFFLEDLDLMEKIRKKLEKWGQAMSLEVQREREGAAWREVEMETTIEDSMLRSGIALAGANTSKEKGWDYGIFTAKKVTGVNLRGTWLAVASACETAVGKPKVGEGVFGLKRAFMLAGAETLMMSLWKVPDKATKDMMVRFYNLMLEENKGKAEALRKTRLEMKEKKPHPYFWGAFISVGKPD